MSNERTRTLGILGGGQLARMLFEASPVPTLVYADQKNSSAERTGATIVAGKLDDAPALENFLTQVDEVIIESEFIPVDVLETLEKSEHAKKFTPPISALRRIQTKLSQKRLLRDLGIPSAPFHEVTREPAAAAKLELAVAFEAEGPFVVKSSQGGYDGKGVLMVSQLLDLDAPLTAFLQANPSANLYRESKINFRLEVALVGARDHSGNCFFYPLVESRQSRGVCEEVLTLESDLYTLLQQPAEEIGRKLLEELRWTGVLAIEFFLTEDLRLLVNELAPRVHNSAHFTLEASARSQFANHVRAALGQTLNAEDFATRPAFAMLNLLGPEGLAGELPPLRMLVKGHAPVYDYQKGASRPRRKMGHWNWVSDKPVERTRIEAALVEMRETWEAWLARETGKKEL